MDYYKNYKIYYVVENNLVILTILFEKMIKGMARVMPLKFEEVIYGNSK